MAGYPQFNMGMQSGMGFGMQGYMPPSHMAQGQPQPLVTNLNRVTGVDGARAFPVAPGSVVPLFDDTRDVFYIKTTDSGGFPTIKAYTFVPLEENASATMPGAMTRTEIEQIVREEMQKYGQQFIQPATPGGAVPGNERISADSPA